MPWWIRSSVFALAALSSLVACNAIVGMEDVTLASSATDGGADASDGSPDVSGDSGPKVALGGAVHFLQSGNTLRIKNGASSIDVSTNGAFSLPAITSGRAYDVTVETVTGDAVCSVRSGGKGTATADVTNVAIGCAAAKEFTSALSPGKSYTTQSPTYVDFDVANPVTLGLENDVATKALVTVSFPQLAPPFKGIGTYAIFVDGAAVAEAVFEDVISSAGVPMANYAVVDLAPGAHVVTAKWRAATLDSPPQPASFDRARAIRLSAIALDSLATFGEVVSASANQTYLLNQTQLVSSEAAAVSLTLPAAAPLLALGRIPLLGSQSVSLVGVQGVLDLNGDRFRTQHVSGWGERNTIVMAGLTPSAAAGPYSLYSLVGPVSTETWAKGDGTGTLPIKVRHDLVAWRPGTTALRGVAGGDKTTSATTFSDLDPSAAITLSPTKTTLAFVVLHEVATWSTGSGNTGEVALDLDGTRVVATGVTSTRPFARGMTSPTFVLLRLAPGAHTLKPVFRSRADGVEGSSNVFHAVDVSVSAIVLD